jgi:hypothetical protein
MNKNALIKLTKQEIDALTNVDLGASNANEKKYILLYLLIFFAIAMGTIGFVAANVEYFISSSGEMTPIELVSAKVGVYQRLVQASILTIVVLLTGFFNFFFTLTAFSVLIISLFSLVEDFSYWLALGSTNLNAELLALATMRIMAIIALGKLVHYIVTDSSD